MDYNEFISALESQVRSFACGMCVYTHIGPYVMHVCFMRDPYALVTH